MKVKLEPDLQLVITPENYVEQLALSLWAARNKEGTGLLIESFIETKKIGCPSCQYGLCSDGRGGYIPCTVCGNTVQPTVLPEYNFIKDAQ